MGLRYESLEKLTPPPPVDRLAYISSHCVGQRVLDLGGLDETALVKRDTVHWLHGRIAEVAASVVGIDHSEQLPPEGLRTGERSVIYRGDATRPDLWPAQAAATDVDVLVAGEFIEHVENPLGLLRALRAHYPGKTLILSTPNGCTFANTLLGCSGREVQHHDHLQVFSYKILNTLALRAGFSDWQILPYRFYATEMILQSHGVKRGAAVLAQSVIRWVERRSPLLSFGYIVHARL